MTSSPCADAANLSAATTLKPRRRSPTDGCEPSTQRVAHFARAIVHGGEQCADVGRGPVPRTNPTMARPQAQATKTRADRDRQNHLDRRLGTRTDGRQRDCESCWGPTGSVVATTTALSTDAGQQTSTSSRTAQTALGQPSPASPDHPAWTAASGPSKRRRCRGYWKP